MLNSSRRAIDPSATNQKTKCFCRGLHNHDKSRDLCLKAESYYMAFIGFNALTFDIPIGSLVVPFWDYLIAF